MEEKYNNLIKYIEKLNSVIVAFSGGVDSTFLLYSAKKALGDKVKAITITSPYISKNDTEEAEKISKIINVKHEVIEFPIIDEIKNNPIDRCYKCKKNIFQNLVNISKKEGYEYVIEGTNYDDIKDYRPGLKALNELSIVSPLLKCEFTKKEIRNMSKVLGIKEWNKPSAPCLLTRIPYNRAIEKADLLKVEKSERYLHSIGLKVVRVRCDKDSARIEVDSSERKKFFDEGFLDKVSHSIKKLGFKYVALDLEGYKSGSLNNEILSIGGKSNG